MRVLVGVRPRRPGLDEAAIREFLASECPRLIAAVALVCGNATVAEDAVEEALARARERSERGEEIRSLSGWVLTVALNLVRSGFRRAILERRYRERESFTRSPDVAATDEILDLQRALSALPRRQREAVVLHYYLDLPVAEVGRVLGMSEGTVKTTLFRARHALARTLGDPDTEEATDAVT